MELYRDEVVAVLQEYIDFVEEDTTTNNLSAKCPFHKGGQESRPSFYVYVGKPTGTRHTGMAFCHTCNEGWSFTGLLKKLKVSSRVVDTIQQVLRDDNARKPKTAKAANFDFRVLPEAILGMFEYLPKEMLTAGFKENVLRNYDVGFDRERKRITFALRNHHGELVGMSGRTTRGEMPRYKIYRSEFYSVDANYQFNKSHILYGLDKIYAKRLYTKVDMPLVICEGFKACLWTIQAGYTDTVALLGSHMSVEQKLLVNRIANDVVIFMDDDEAGRKASWSIARNLSGVNVKIAEYPRRGVSPDDLSVKEVRLAVESAMSPLEKKRRIKNGRE
jgi:DNA primase